MNRSYDPVLMFKEYKVLNPRDENLILSSDDPSIHMLINRYSAEEGPSNISLAAHTLYRREQDLHYNSSNNSFWSDDTLRNILYQYRDDILEDEEVFSMIELYGEGSEEIELDHIDTMSRETLIKYTNIIISDRYDARDVGDYHPEAEFMALFINDQNRHFICPDDEYLLYGIHIDEAIKIQDQLVQELLDKEYIQECRGVNLTRLLFYET